MPACQMDGCAPRKRVLRLQPTGRPNGSDSRLLSSLFSPSIDCDQWDTQIADFAKQAMQRGLVDHRAMDDGCAVALVGEAQAVEPGRPAGLEVPLDSDCVAPSFVHRHAPKVDSEVVSPPHHMW